MIARMRWRVAPPTAAIFARGGAGGAYTQVYRERGALVPRDAVTSDRRR
jgi:hypothetical protein